MGDARGYLGERYDRRRYATGAGLLDGAGHAELARSLQPQHEMTPSAASAHVWLPPATRVGAGRRVDRRGLRWWRGCDLAIAVRGAAVPGGGRPGRWRRCGGRVQRDELPAFFASAAALASESLTAASSAAPLASRRSTWRHWPRCPPRAAPPARRATRERWSHAKRRSSPHHSRCAVAAVARPGKSQLGALRYELRMRHDDRGPRADQHDDRQQIAHARLAPRRRGAACRAGIPLARVGTPVATVLHRFQWRASRTRAAGAPCCRVAPAVRLGVAARAGCIALARHPLIVGQRSQKSRRIGPPVVA